MNDPIISLTYFHLFSYFIRKLKVQKMVKIISVYQFVYILTSEGENLTATSQSRLLLENRSNAERVAASQLEKENNKNKSILIDNNCIST